MSHWRHSSRPRSSSSGRRRGSVRGLEGGVRPEGIDVVWDRRLGERRAVPERYRAGSEQAAKRPSRIHPGELVPPRLPGGAHPGSDALSRASRRRPGRSGTQVRVPTTAGRSPAASLPRVTSRIGTGIPTGNSPASTTRRDWLGAVSSSKSWSSRPASATRFWRRRTLARPMRSAVKCGSTARALPEVRFRALQAAPEERGDLVVHGARQVRSAAGSAGSSSIVWRIGLAHARAAGTGTGGRPESGPSRPELMPKNRWATRRAGRERDRAAGRLLRPSGMRRASARRWSPACPPDEASTRRARSTSPASGSRRAACARPSRTVSRRAGVLVVSRGQRLRARRRGATARHGVRPEPTATSRAAPAR